MVGGIVMVEVIILGLIALAASLVGVVLICACILAGRADKRRK